MTWSPRKAESRADFLEGHRHDPLRPRLRMSIRVSLVIFAVLATLIIIALLIIIAGAV